MLTFLSGLQLVLYIALLAMLGQGLLYLLAGAKRETNIFYQLLRIISKPATALVRRLTLAYIVVTIERISVCVSLNMVGCK